MAKKKAGRPKIVWDESQYKVFQGLCSIQATTEEIENVLGLDHKTIYRLCKEHYKDENGEPMEFSQVYKKYASNGKISLRRMQFKSAEAGSVPMQIWLGKQILGQKESPLEEVAADRNITINISPATKADAEEIEE